MAVVDGPFDFTGFNDNGKSTDPNQPCNSSYEPTPINISTEAPTTKKQKVAGEVTVVVTSKRLPEPCPLPIIFEKTKEILAGGIKGNNKFFY